MQVYACCLSIYELWLFPWVGWWFTWLVQHYFLDCTSISSQDRITGIHIAAAKSRHVNVCCIKIDIIEHQRYCQLHATKTIASIKQMILQKIPNSQKSWQNLSWSTRLPFLPLQKSMHGSLGTKQHGYHAISIFSNSLCPCKWSWLPSVWYVFQIAQHAICPEYNTILVWISYDFTLPSPSSCSFRWATCGAFPLSFAASWGCIIIGWVLDCCLC